MNQDEKARFEASQPQRRAFHAESVDLQKAKVHWRLGNSAPDLAVLRNKLDDQAFALNWQPYDRDKPDSNPIKQLPEFNRAKDLIERIVNDRGRIIIYGDFDCDGITSITLMRDLLLACKLPEGHIQLLVPPRLVYGYGFHWDYTRRAVRRLEEADEAPSLVIIVDCGSGSIEDIKKALNDGLSVLVIDHHNIDATAPKFEDPRFVHLNPKLTPRHRVLQDPCAAGLVYLFADALVHGRASWDQDRALLLAGMATCVDVVPLFGINRWLLNASKSLANRPEILKRVPGLYWMAKRPRTPKDEPVSHEIYYSIDEHTYGFEWGPCLNAPGRMSTAETALKLLLANVDIDEDEIKGVIQSCRNMNQWRRATNNAIEEMALVYAESIMRKSNPDVLLIWNATWHPGVVGIVASRIKDLYHRPTIICTKSADGKWRGSGRSIKNLGCTPFDMGAKFHEAMDQNKIIRGGGHKMAGGLAFSRNQLRQLERWMQTNSGLVQDDFVPKVMAYASPSMLTPEEWWGYFNQLRPFGSDNPCPPLIVEAAELKAIRTRTRMPRSFKKMETTDGFVLAEKAPVKPKPENRQKGADVAPDSKPHGNSLLEAIRAAKPRPEVWAYEGVFLDLATQKIFFAHWLDIDWAEKLWHINKFMRCDERFAGEFVWPHHFKLELQLQSFIPSSQWAAVKEGKKKPDWEYNFRILQCLPLP